MSQIKIKIKNNLSDNYEKKSSKPQRFEYFHDFNSADKNSKRKRKNFQLKLKMQQERNKNHVASAANSIQNLFSRFYSLFIFI